MIDSTIIIGSLGILFGLLVNPFQIVKTIKNKSAKGISKWTYITLTAALICYLIRAIAIMEWVFIISNCAGLISSLFMLILIWKYGDN